uniref:Uncharacterized protein n=1 Tax=Manihot esculenta TaxID=3983 RepID=A0A2C9U7Y8_MANES
MPKEICPKGIGTSSEILIAHRDNGICPQDGLKLLQEETSKLIALQSLGYKCCRLERSSPRKNFMPKKICPIARMQSAVNDCLESHK